MKPLSLSRLAAMLGGELYLESPGPPAVEGARKATKSKGASHRPGEEIFVTGWALDHRQVSPGDAFLAIKGAKFDGHDAAEAAISAGATVVISERVLPVPHILVVNLVSALALMAGGFRNEFKGPVIGITGSAGKTTTKELLAAALEMSGPVLKTTGNRNTEFTAPLLWADLEPQHRYVVTEMAMRGAGQIEHLAKFSKPTIGVVTNIGHAHLELLGSREAIAYAKGELLAALPAGGNAIVWDEDEYRDLLEEISAAPVLHFGFGEESACRIVDFVPLGLSGSRISGDCLGERWEAWLPAPGRHLALNAAAAILAARIAGVPASKATEGLAKVELPSMRMEVRDLGGITILLDAYNASPSSMEAAIETLSGAPASGKKFAVVGDMRELGDYAEVAHRELAVNLCKADLAGVIAVGEWAPVVVDELKHQNFKGRIASVVDADQAKIILAQWVKPGDAVLVKGSRALALEKVVQP